MPRKQTASIQDVERKGTGRDTSREGGRSATKPTRKKAGELNDPPPMVRQRPASRERRAAELEMPPDEEE